MAFDAGGRLLIAGCGSGTIYVLVPDLTGVQHTLVCEDPALTNLCLGGEDFKTLFVTQGASGSVATIRWHVPGMVLFSNRAKRFTENAHIGVLPQLPH